MPGAARCANCDAALAGRYCAACGQEARARVTVGSLTRDALRGVTSLEEGFDRTALDMLRRPGPMVRDWIGGRTRPYTSPLKYAIIAAAVAAVLMLLLGVLDTERHRIIDIPQDWAVAGEMGAVNTMYLRFMNLFLLFMIPVSATSTWLLFRRERLTYGEHVVFNAFVFGTATLGCALLMLPVFLGLGGERAARFATVMIWLLGCSGYFVLACLSFFEGGLPRKATLAVLAGLMSYFVYFALTIVALIGYAWVRLLL